MQTVILQGNSKDSLKLLTDLAKKIGISVRYLTDEEKEDIGMLVAINREKTGEYVDTAGFIEDLRK
jgi:hypothetical protein